MNNQEKWKKVITILQKFHNYQDNWDGEGSKAPSKTTLENTQQLIQILIANNTPPPQYLTLWIKGEIFLEWNNKTEWLDIEINNNTTLIGQGTKDQQTLWSTLTTQELIQNAHLLKPPTKQQHEPTNLFVPDAGLITPIE